MAMKRRGGQNSDSQHSPNSELPGIRRHPISPWSEPTLLFGGRKARYVPLAISRTGTVQETPYRIVMLGDYASGVSMLRSEMTQLNSVRDIPFSDAECCTTITQDGRELQLWLFVDLPNFELFCKQCTESIDCCIACYSTTLTQTYRNAVGKWIPGFLNNFPDKPIILCALNDCEGCTCGSSGIEETILQNDFNFSDNNLTQMDVSVFDKRSVKSLYECIKSILKNPNCKRKNGNKLKSCSVM